MTEPIRFVDLDDVLALVSVDDALEAATAAARAVSDGRVVTGRLQLSWGDDDSGMRVMVAALPDLDVFGYKQFHWVGDSVHYSCHLFRASDGSPLGAVDAAPLTTLRTAATAALGVERLYGRGRAAVAAVIGSGAEARAGLRALAAVVDLTEVRVTSRRAGNRESFAADLSAELGVPVLPVASVRAATEGADLAYSATQSNGSVVFDTSDLNDVQVLATIGSTAPDQREAAGDVFTGAGVVVVDTRDVLEESGDLLESVDEHGLDPASVRLLGDLLDSEVVPAEGPGLRVFKSIGSPEQDVVLAHTVLQRADAQDAGRLVRPATSRKQNL